MEEDKELEYLKAKKMLELRRKMAAAEKPKAKVKSSRDIVASKLVNRGLEVLELAEKYYPEKSTFIVKKLADLIETKGISGYISGGELLWLFRQLGLNIQVKTSIQVEKDGKLVPLTEKLKSED
jgi:DNA-binding TFAR19-related protein (PDSD5 family)